MVSPSPTSPQNVSASFRDPSGFVFKRDGKYLRQVNRAYKESYDLLMTSGLYEKLVANGLLIAHKEINSESAADPAYKIIEPQQLAFISYPYEWSFSQLKDAALCTLSIQRTAIDRGMILKDASAYNVQFINGKPVFIDTLSFDKYNEGEPWIAYRQFCQHFLAPLALMSYRDVRLSKLLSSFIDGIPLDLASTLLPGKTKFNFALLTHVHLHASTQKRYESDTSTKSSGKKGKVTKLGMLGILDNLKSLVEGLKWNPGGTEWADYYNDTNYSDSSFAQKKEIITGFIDRVNPSSVWDLGANTGLFSRLAADKNIDTVAFDIDPSAVEKNYLRVRHENELHILPLVMDLTNPSPGIGWNNDERNAFGNRGGTDMMMALALIHHLAISNNVPLSMIAAFFASVGKHAIVEFVPKSDSQVKRLLATREDIFDRYDQTNFEKDFSEHFDVLDAVPVSGSERTLYLLRAKQLR